MALRCLNCRALLISYVLAASSVLSLVTISKLEECMLTATAVVHDSM